MACFTFPFTVMKDDTNINIILYLTRKFEVAVKMYMLPL